MGTPDNLILGLTRDWILDRLMTGYPIDVLVDLLAEAEVSAFDRRRYDDAYRLRHLKTRLLNGPKFQIPDAIRLKVCSWKCVDDGAVLDEALCIETSITSFDMAGLGHALQWKLDREAIEWGKMLSAGIEGIVGLPLTVAIRAKWNEVLHLGKVFAELNTIDIENISPKGAFNAGDLRLTATFVNGLATRQDLARIMALRTELIRPSRKKLTEDAAIRCCRRY